MLLEGFSKRHNHSDEISALPGAWPLGMFGTAASICLLCNIFLHNKVQKLFAEISDTRKCMKFKLIHTSEQILTVQVLKTQISTVIAGILSVLTICRKRSANVFKYSLHHETENYHISLLKGLNQARFLACSGKTWS